ncbi:MAG TPA: GNAT family protein [Xanthobacteraceae bacterium]|nr:GNAT family protein [Xanthobacteraceae bacterium]
MPDIHPDTGQPVGFRVDSRPAALPQGVTLCGRYGGIERLDAARHRADLWDAVAGHANIWTYMRYGPFADAAVFSDWLASREGGHDPFYYAVVDPSGRALGLAALMRIEPDMRIIEVGNILLSPSLQRTPLATEAQYLLARYVFETLGYRRYEWKCDALNGASRRAALRFGFSFEGIFRDHMIIKGRSRDTAWFAMLETEWPARKAAFERWLAPENFNAAGTQRKKLGEFRSS